MIASFRDTETAQIFLRKSSRRWNAIANIARRKLDLIEAATSLSDLKSPPGNRLHALHGNRKGQHSFSINGQCRICFAWKSNGAHDVEITAYHSEGGLDAHR